MRRPVWIVVLNWNGKADTLELLQSLRGVDAQVLVVDNGSTDGSVQAIRAAYPDVELLQTGANLGYAGGNNRGVERAVERGAEIICLLNNDTLADPGFLGPLEAAVRVGSRIAVSPVIRYADDPDLTWFSGGIVDRRLGRPVHAPVDRTEFLTGCCIVLTTEVWRLVGPFDEALFLTFEDNDWSLRARSRGVQLEVVRDSTIRHRVSRSIGTDSALGAYYFSRNTLIFAFRYLGPVCLARAFSRGVVRPALSDLRRRRPRVAAARLVGAVAAALGTRGPAGRIATWCAGNP